MGTALLCAVPGFFAVQGYLLPKQMPDWRQRQTWIDWRIAVLFWRRAERVTGCGRQGSESKHKKKSEKSREACPVQTQ